MHSRVVGVRTLVAYVLIAAAAQPARSVETPVRAIDRYVWDLASLYPDDDAWEADRDTVLRRLETIGQIQGTLGRDARGLAEGLDAIADLRGRAAKLVVYGMLQEEVDTQSEAAKRHYDVGSALEIQVEAAVSFAKQEIPAIGAARLDSWLRLEPRLERHRRRINRIVREAPYTLDPQAQALIESMARWPRLAADTFWALQESDLGWPKLANPVGHDTTVDLAAFQRLRRSQDPDQREAAQDYLRRLRALEDVFGLLLTRRIEADWIIAKQRHFDEGMEALWFLRDGMPRGSHRIMIEVAQANRPSLHRYAELRRRALDLKRLSYADLFVSPPDVERGFPIEAAIEIAVAASAPLGADYQTRLRERLEQPWMHLAPLPHKRASYAIFPPVGGAAPYVLMSYEPSYRYSRALCGALTLMMSFADIPREHAPETRDDPGIYSNGVIYTGDLLHDDYLIETTIDPSQRIAVVLSALDLLWRHYFRWTLVAEFESEVQEAIRHGATPGGARLSQTYLDLLRSTYGHEDGGVVVEEPFAAEWMTLSVPFLSYEHQFWPPAMAAACLLVERLRQGDPRAVQGIHRALGRGELDLTYQLLQPAGIDLASPEPYQAVIRRMNRLMLELENLLAGRLSERPAIRVYPSPLNGGSGARR